MQYEPKIGDVIADKYCIERVLGVGGMGMVVAARHLELEQLVAIKFLLPEALGNAEAVARFAREARASVRIKSEHVARTLDVGKLGNGAPYMVMEYLEGADLGARLQQCGRLPVEPAVGFMLQTCEALADAHALGIIHRDLKPSNLFVIRKTDGTECIKVLDFGISKISGAAGTKPELRMTRTSSLMGSPVYMAPEQMASARNVDARSDLWALGVTLYELLTGSPPFVAETITELVTKVLTQPTPDLCQTLPDAPAGLNLVIARCLEKKPSARYANVAELALALSEFASRRARYSVECVSRVLVAAGLSAHAIEVSPSIEPAKPEALSPPAAAIAANVPTATVASWGRTRSPTGRRAAVIASAVALVGVGGLAVSIALWGRSAKTRSSTPDLGSADAPGAPPGRAAPALGASRASVGSQPEANPPEVSLAGAASYSVSHQSSTLVAPTDSRGARTGGAPKTTVASSALPSSWVIPEHRSPAPALSIGLRSGMPRSPSASLPTPESKPPPTAANAPPPAAPPPAAPPPAPVKRNVLDIGIK